MNTSTKNELIAIINDCRASGTDIKAIRKQKFDLSNFYMTRSDGKQVGPVKCEGNTDELNRKYDEAIAYLKTAKCTPKRAA
jgi:hypothetical protein